MLGTTGLRLKCSARSCSVANVYMHRLRVSGSRPADCIGSFFRPARYSRNRPPFSFPFAALCNTNAREMWNGVVFWGLAFSFGHYLNFCHEELIFFMFVKASWNVVAVRELSVAQKQHNNTTRKLHPYGKCVIVCRASFFAFLSFASVFLFSLDHEEETKTKSTQLYLLSRVWIHFHAPTELLSCFLFFFNIKEKKARLHNTRTTNKDHGRNSEQFLSSKTIPVPEKRPVCFRIILADLRIHFSGGSMKRSKHAYHAIEG